MMLFGSTEYIDGSWEGSGRIMSFSFEGYFTTGCPSLLLWEIASGWDGGLPFGALSCY
jgi:hypothetical protein